MIVSPYSCNKINVGRRNAGKFRAHLIIIVIIVVDFSCYFDYCSILTRSISTFTFLNGKKGFLKLFLFQHIQIVGMVY